MIDAKVKNKPLPKEAPEAKSTKVVSLMDALRKSVQGDSGEGTSKGSKPVSVMTSASKPKAKSAKPAAKRKSA